ncbi:MAG: Serine/threonine-protein kinase pkn1 [Planctomycetes bacterium ADurb.Bin126]|nr:MAG: Serine/threonine-protein kinase pkn1 [Planctomycetes bacterium ADurb.Bin126]HOD82284.1 formylglycine-generating enzyme family protein [Phycisphaerae bacterium]HQL72903.1 formylglycine-generating enzyme family protein [Phycisphaerae bacterium]
MKCHAFILAAMAMWADSCAGPERSPASGAGADLTPSTSVKQPSPAPLAPEVSVELDKGVRLSLVLIRPGSFLMGSPDDLLEREADEQPRHEVTITRPFYMGVTEVTQAQYQAVMDKNPSLFMGADRPVERVIWDDAVEFCRRLSERQGHPVRLPTEAEWEYACRAGSNTRFSFGDKESELPRYANFGDRSVTGPALYRQEQYDDGHDKTAPVASFPANAWGLHDMHGNVFEWCQDWYRDVYYKTSPTVDPLGADIGPYRVLRGGSWNSPSWQCRSAYRHRFTADGRFNHQIGFRIVIPAPVEPHVQQ